MRTRFRAIYLIICCFLPLACMPGGTSAKRELANGFYKEKKGKNLAKERVYLHLSDSGLHVYNTEGKGKNTKIIKDSVQFFEEETEQANEKTIHLTEIAHDVDFLTIPLKLRFQAENVPTQLNSSINGAVYAGIRQDRYRIHYQKMPLGNYERNIRHLGYSLGLFSGFGNTFMSPTNTLNGIDQEYDGLVWNKGFAFILSVNSFSLGITLGFDHLLDYNKNLWIYQGKPWLGIGIGLHLN